MSYIVTGLTDYTKVNKDLLIKRLVLGEEYGDVIPNLRKQLNIKTKERLNYLNVDPVFQDGRGCGFSAQGTTEFTEREIETAIIKINDAFCNDDLLNKYYEYQVRIAASPNADHLAFEEEILGEITSKTAKKMEELVWQGKTSAHSGTDLINGFLTRALNEDSASTVAVSIASGESVYNAIKSVIMAIPERIIDKATVFVAPAIYRAFVQELIEKNYYHYKSGEIEVNDLVFPGTSIKVHKTYGLKGDKRHIYASCYENMVFGTDLMNDMEDIQLWFDPNSDLHKLKIKWNAGVQTLYADMVVLGTAASDLV